TWNAARQTIYRRSSQFKIRAAHGFDFGRRRRLKRRRLLGRDLRVKLSSAGGIEGVAARGTREPNARKVRMSVSQAGRRSALRQRNRFLPIDRDLAFVVLGNSGIGNQEQRR